MTKSNLDLARECFADVRKSLDGLAVVSFLGDELDAFAERIRSESKQAAIDSPEPSGERAALIKRLRDSGKSVMETIKDALQAADMLAADAPGVCDTPNYCKSVQRCTAMDESRAKPAPQARELSDDEIEGCVKWLGDPKDPYFNRIDFARAVLVARSEP